MGTRSGPVGILFILLQFFIARVPVHKQCRSQLSANNMHDWARDIFIIDYVTLFSRVNELKYIQVL